MCREKSMTRPGPTALPPSTSRRRAGQRACWSRGRLPGQGIFGHAPRGSLYWDPSFLEAAYQDRLICLTEGRADGG